MSVPTRREIEVRCLAGECSLIEKARPALAAHNFKSRLMAAVHGADLPAWRIAHLAEAMRLVREVMT